MAAPGTPYGPEAWTEALAAVTKTLLATSADWSGYVQDEMRSGARWTDRGGQDSVTGKSARESLEAEAGLSDDGTEIIIVGRSTRESTHQWRGGPHAPVGAFLELGTRFMHERYAIIQPTLEQNTARLQQMLTNALHDITLG